MTPPMRPVRGAICRAIARDLRLARGILAAVAVAAVDHHARGQSAVAHQRDRLRHAGGVVVGRACRRAG